MKQVRPVTGKTLQEFADAMNEAYCELSRFTIEQTEKVSPFEAIIYYDIPDEPEPLEALGFSDADYDIEFDGVEGQTETVKINLRVGDHKDRRCCECYNLDWGRGCPYRDGHVRVMDRACPMFNVSIEVRP